jgi:hypothetical protein
MLSDVLNYQPEPLLLSVVGGSPQVITETLYGIYKSSNPMPKKIKVITTEFGKDKILKAPMLGVAGYINQFTQDYNLEPISFTEDDILVVSHNGKPLADARTEDEHATMADFIIGIIRSLTQQVHKTEFIPIDTLPGIDADQDKKVIEELIAKQLELNTGFKCVKKTSAKKQSRVHAEYDKYTVHASIAGGRKSMTFLLGYAMSLFAREHDIVSHVLVDEVAETYDAGFYYPSAEKDMRTIKSLGKEVDFNKVEVSLGELPLVRMGQNMPQVLLKGERSYSETIDLFNRFNEVPKLVLNLAKLDGFKKGKNLFNATFNDEMIELDIENMALLLALSPFNEQQDARTVQLAMLSSYASLLTGFEQRFDNLHQAVHFFNQAQTDMREDYLFGNFLDADRVNLFCKENPKDENITPELCGGLIGSYDAFSDYFSKQRNTLFKSLEKVLGDQLSKRYLPNGIGSGTTRGYELAISPDNITILNPFVE